MLIENHESDYSIPKVLKQNHIMQLLKSKIYKNEVIDTFLYSFVDIEPDAVKKLINMLDDYKVETEDTTVSKIIFDWYANIKPVDKIGFPMTNEEYQENKAATLAKVITANMSFKEIENLNGKALLDIGAGDCAMTYLVSKQLEMSANGIDIKMEIDWGGVDTSIKKESNEYRNQLQKHYEYDGKNLKGAVNGKKFRVIMYNHSLHHFPSFKAQMDNLRQASEILEPSGIIFFSEHANCLNDNILDLSHILLNLRYSIDKNKILNQQDAALAIEQFKSEYQSNYFSKNMINFMLNNLEFTLNKETIRGKNDIAKATFYCFVKKDDQKELNYKVKFFESHDAEGLKTLEEPSDNELAEKIRRKSL